MYVCAHRIVIYKYPCGITNGRFISIAIFLKILQRLFNFYSASVWISHSYTVCQFLSYPLQLLHLWNQYKHIRIISISQPLYSSFCIAILLHIVTIIRDIKISREAILTDLCCELWRFHRSPAGKQRGNNCIMNQLLAQRGCWRRQVGLLLRLNVILDISYGYSWGNLQSCILTHLPLNKMAVISPTIFSNAFSSMKKKKNFDSKFIDVCS